MDKCQLITMSPDRREAERPDLEEGEQEYRGRDPITRILLSLVGAALQDRKKEVLMGDAWQQWEAKTSYWPKLQRILAVGLLPWIGGMAVWLGASWLHKGVEAGVWRWL